MRLCAVLLGVVMLAGCAGRPGLDSLVETDAPAPDATMHTILVASTRAKDPRPGAIYSCERSTALSFARVEMSVPPTHKPGLVEWPKSSPGNPETDMVVRQATYQETPQEFDAVLKAELAKRPVGKKKVAIFVHGYNTQFNEALYRMTQLVEDSKAGGVPVLFTWASRGETTDYVYDTNSATSARDRLEDTIRLVFNSGAEKVTILAHSMGNWVTVEALRQIKISGNTLPADKIDNIILAAPDIDVDVFKSQLKRFGRPAKPFVVVVSADDKALAFSSFIAGGEKRLGAYTHDDELVELGAVVVDMSKVKAEDEFNHGKFAQLVAMAPELQAIANSKKSTQREHEIVIGDVAFFGFDKLFPGGKPGSKTTPAATTVANSATSQDNTSTVATAMAPAQSPAAQ